MLIYLCFFSKVYVRYWLQTVPSFFSTLSTNHQCNINKSVTHLSNVLDELLQILRIKASITVTLKKGKYFQLKNIFLPFVDHPKYRFNLRQLLIG